MNIFRFFGDMLHLLSIFLLLVKLRKSKSCLGISCRMQEIYLIVFCSRYIDLLWSFVSVYNSLMKVIFIGSTSYCIYLMRYQIPISRTYDKSADNFSYQKYLLLPALLLGIITSDKWIFSEILWGFSIWLESVAILPQLILLQKMREVENLTSNYVVTMGLYRLFYIFNWIYRFYIQHYVNWVGWIGGVIQTAIYVDFFYYYAMSKWYGQKLILPYAVEV
ncbi:ER lumen protein retaining receptor protein, putative [Cryptosporidium muris RN66]|uniref:ER lumen protein-retaining receptor n=2 Tax=Cryptosporidium TaxID=5806 RepID=B6AAU4_CRYMR|nr:ER lumen protein retaining receptor protein, putative [Cryptosporidium muris RN66]EEA05496.1 ER lumen protein retaining receptor protein, putative [Cryptosporidium muris RN66]OII77053.1 ER lumen protein retaining receptor protein [Cryptosporidium andersoni]|eukprot:XP_002139845.1 ER lumen protein retaining receptor protein [Cryptosporidium muris RN66]